LIFQWWCYPLLEPLQQLAMRHPGAIKRLPLVASGFPLFFWGVDESG